MGNDLETYLIQKAALMGTPIKVTLELTPLCNMDCKMCYVHRTVNEANQEGGLKSLEYWESLIPEMKELGVLFVALIGGEPFLYAGLQSLYEKLYKNGFYINLTTNATLLSDEVPQWLIAHPPRYVTISLYGASDETYEKVTGNSNGFTQALRGLRNLLNANIPVKLNYVMIPDNADDLEKIIELKEYYQLPLLATSYCFPQIRKTQKNSFERFSSQECAKQELKIKAFNDSERYLEKIQYFAAEKFNQNTAKHSEKMYCHAGASTFWVTWQGNMIPCGMMKSISLKSEIGKLKKNWEKLKSLTSEAKICAECANCEKREICQVCPAMMEAETGKVDGCPEYLCQVTEEMIKLSKIERETFDKLL